MLNSSKNLSRCFYTMIILTIICISCSSLKINKINRKKSKLLERNGDIIRDDTGFEIFNSLFDDPTIVTGAVSRILYQGTWSGNSDTQNKFLNSKNGRFLGMIMSIPKNKIQMAFQIYENSYIDTPLITSYLNTDLISNDQSTFSSSGNSKLIQEKSLYSKELKIDCNLTITMNLINKETGKAMPISSNEISKAQLLGHVISEDCQIDFEFTSSLSSPELIKALIFTIIEIMFIIIGISPLYKMLKRNNMNQILIINQWAFLGNIMLDLVISVVNLTFSMRILVEYFEFLTVITMFLMFSILFKIRFYLYANEIRLANTEFDERRRSRKKFFSMLIFVAFCILSVACGNFLIMYDFLFYILFCYPIFQIIYNINNVNRNNCYIWEIHPALIFSQIFYPIFMKGTSISFFKLTPDNLFPIIILSLSIFFNLFLFLQKSFGACFFLPKCMIPNYFNYFKKFEQHRVKEDETCPICFSLLTESPETDENDKVIGLLPKRYMETPCNHMFHEECLKEWMQQKLICPCCRKRIPPII